MEENRMENGELSKIEYKEHHKEEPNEKTQPFLAWWNRKSFWEKLLIFALIFVTIFLMIFVPLSLSKTQVKADQICYSDACIRKAGQILTNMDKTANPCENFYRFACGNYGKEGGGWLPSQIKVDLQMREILEEVIPEDIKPYSMVRSFYRACLNQSRIEREGLEIAKNIISKAGGWPVLNNSTTLDSNIPKWSDMIVKMRELGLPFQHLFSISLERDNGQNSNMSTITIDQPKLDLGFGHYTISVWEKRKFYESLAMYFGANDLEILENDINEVLEFENDLKNMTMSRKERLTDPNNLTNLHMPSEVWGEILDILNRVMPQNNSTSFIREKINVKAPSYFKGLPELLKKTPNRVLTNYMMWRTVKTFKEFLPEKGRQIIKDFGIRKIDDPRWKKCIKKLDSSHLKIALASMYASKFQNDAKEAKKLVDHLKDAFSEELIASSWMDSYTKSAALSKLDAMKSSLDTLLGNITRQKVEEYYKNIPYFSDENTSLLEMNLILNKFYTDYKLSNPTSVEVNDWKKEILDAIRPVAGYYVTQNKIVISPFFMRSYTLDINLPNYLNFGSLGWTISHKTSQRFADQVVSKYGGNAWTKIQKCFVDQNDQFVRMLTGKINPIDADSWNITDENNWSHNMGMRIARRGYNDWKNKFKGGELKLVGLGNYTDGQLFWISSANTYCSYRTSTEHFHLEESFRILGPMINSEEFAKDFNCPVGSNMNPVKKCSV